MMEETAGGTCSRGTPRPATGRQARWASGCSACTRTANTCANLLHLWPSLWTFTADASLAPTNNAAEQALRSLVLKRKISGPTRSLRGDQFLARGYTAHESRSCTTVT